MQVETPQQKGERWLRQIADRLPEAREHEKIIRARQKMRETTEKSNG